MIHVKFGQLTTNILLDEGARRSFMAEKLELNPSGVEEINNLGYGD